MPKIDRSQFLKFAGFAVLACVFIGLALFFVTQDVDTLRDQTREILEAARSTGWSYPIVCGLYLLASLVMFPIIALNLATAIVFGPIYGTIYSLTGTLLSGTVFFYIGRFGRNRGLKKLLEGKKLSKLDSKLKDSGVIGVAMLRLVPIAPFGIFNMAAGITSLRFIDYIAGTFIAFWPGGIARAIVGDSLVKLFLEPTPQSFAYLIVGVLIWGSIVLGLHFGLKKYRGASA